MTSAPLSLPSDRPGREPAPLPEDGTAGSRSQADPVGGYVGGPVTVIEPDRARRLVDGGELWRYRELLFFLVWRDLKVQYKQTVLGPLWVVINPLVQLLVLSFVFGRLVQVPSDGVPYPVFMFAGLLPWMFFSNGVNQAGTSLLNHAGILSKVYFPRLLLPTACVLVGLVNFTVNMTIFAGLMVWYAQWPGVRLILLPAPILLAAMTSLGIGCGLAGLMVIYRDLRFVIASAVQMLMYLTPVIYPVTLVPESYRWLLALNPMTGIIGAFRAALLDQPLDVTSLGMSAVMAVVILVAGLWCFRRTERRFVDVA